MRSVSSIIHVHCFSNRISPLVKTGSFATHKSVVEIWNVYCYILEGILIPPSNRITVPFNIEFSIPSFTSRANSSGFPGLAGNSTALIKLARTLSLIKAVMPLSKRLGAMVTTLTPYRARSRVNDNVRLAMAPLLAEYDS